MFKWIAIALAIVLVIVGLKWWDWRNSPMREIERSSAAVAAATNWHYHTVQLNAADPSIPPETIDKDTFCPSFQHEIRSGTDRNGASLVRDSIIYFGRSYNHLGDKWILSQGRQADIDAQGSLPIFECLKGAMGTDSNSLPYQGFIDDGQVRRGGIRDVEGEPCRDYEVAVSTPGDPTEKEFRFSMCINEQDHLPRETRRTAPGTKDEGISTFTRWNAVTEPQLPPGFSK